MKIEPLVGLPWTDRDDWDSCLLTVAALSLVFLRRRYFFLVAPGGTAVAVCLSKSLCKFLSVMCIYNIKQ